MSADSIQLYTMRTHVQQQTQAPSTCVGHPLLDQGQLPRLLDLHHVMTVRAGRLGDGPNFEYWRKFPTLNVWEVAVLMAGLDPNTFVDVADENGDAIDVSDSVRMLIAAVMTGAVVAFPADLQVAGHQTPLSVESLLRWLRSNGGNELATGLERSILPQATSVPQGVVSDQERRLSRLRDLGGSASYDKSSGTWKFKGISELIAAERHEGRGRSSDKTIRADLIAAADAERQLKSEGAFANMFRPRPP